MTLQSRLLQISALSAVLILVGFNSSANAQSGDDSAERALRARHELSLGIQAYKGAQYDRAVEHFQNAVQFDDQLAVAKLDLANAYGALWIPGVNAPDNNVVMKNAVDEYNIVLKSDPKNLTALRALASIYMSAREYPDSREYFQRWIQADPEAPEAYYGVAVLDWIAAFPDVAQRRRKLGLKAPVDEKEPAGPQRLCAQIKAADGPHIDEGLKMAQTALEKRASFLAKTSDANSFLYEAKAMQSFVAGDGPTLDAGLASVKARLLILPAQSDVLIYPKYSQDAAEHLKRLGKSVEYHEIPGDGGHLDGMLSIAAVGGFISNFLSQ